MMFVSISELRGLFQQHLLYKRVKRGREVLAKSDIFYINLPQAFHKSSRFAATVQPSCRVNGLYLKLFVDFLRLKYPAGELAT